MVNYDIDHSRDPEKVEFLLSYFPDLFMGFSREGDHWQSPLNLDGSTPNNPKRDKVVIFPNGVLIVNGQEDNTSVFTYVIQERGKEAFKEAMLAGHFSSPAKSFTRFSTHKNGGVLGSEKPKSLFKDGVEKSSAVTAHKVSTPEALDEIERINALPTILKVHETRNSPKLKELYQRKLEELHKNETILKNFYHARGLTYVNFTPICIEPWDHYEHENVLEYLHYARGFSYKVVALACHFLIAHESDLYIPVYSLSSLGKEFSLEALREKKQSFQRLRIEGSGQEAHKALQLGGAKAIFVKGSALDCPILFIKPPKREKERAFFLFEGLEDALAYVQLKDASINKTGAQGINPLASILTFYDSYGKRRTPKEMEKILGIPNVFPVACAVGFSKGGVKASADKASTITLDGRPLIPIIAGDNDTGHSAKNHPGHCACFVNEKVIKGLCQEAGYPVEGKVKDLNDALLALERSGLITRKNITRLEKVLSNRAVATATSVFQAELA